jgi:hypothetical protein
MNKPAQNADYSKIAKANVGFCTPAGKQYYKLFLSPLVERLKGEREEPKIIEIGCGDGRQLSHFSSKIARLVGIDSCEPMIEMARKNAPNARFEIVDFFEPTPYPGKFNMAYGVNITMWPVEAARFAYETLVDGGYGVFNFRTADHKQSREYFARCIRGGSVVGTKGVEANGQKFELIEVDHTASADGFGGIGKHSYFQNLGDLKLFLTAMDFGFFPPKELEFRDASGNTHINYVFTVFKC